jgi:hypothetical protein
VNGAGHCLQASSGTFNRRLIQSDVQSRALLRPHRIASGRDALESSGAGQHHEIVGEAFHSGGYGRGTRAAPQIVVGGSQDFTSSLAR